MSRRRLFELLVARWGFAALVAAVIAIALTAGMAVTPPSSVPSAALQSSAVYRVEVGAAVFFGLYLAAMAFALALQNRGFTEIGSSGIKAQDLATVSRGEAVFMETLAELGEEIQEMRARWEVIEDGRREAVRHSRGDQGAPGADPTRDC